MTLSVFLRNPAKCRGPERSASGFRARGAALCTPGRRCRPAPGSKTGSHAFDGMASCFAGLVHGGAFWCQRYRAIRSWRWNCSAYEHQRASATEAVQRIVEIVVVRLITSDGRRSCRRCDYVQRLQQITKLNRWSCQLLLDDGANRLPQAFVCGCLAVWKNMYACAGATHSAILRCCRTVEPLGLAFRQCSLYPHTHFSLHLSRGLMTGQPGTFLPCYVPWYRFPSQVRQVLSDMEIRLLPCDW